MKLGKKLGKKVRKFFRNLFSEPIHEPRWPPPWRPAKPEDRAFTTFTINMNSSKDIGKPNKISKIMTELQQNSQNLFYCIDDEGNIQVSAESNPAMLVRMIGKRIDKARIRNVRSGQCSSLLRVPWVSMDTIPRAPHYSNNPTSNSIALPPPYPYSGHQIDFQGHGDYYNSGGAAGFYYGPQYAPQLYYRG